LIKRKFSIIGPKVHGVGYRVLLISIALELDVERMRVFNAFVGDQEAVIAILEGEEDQLNSFSNLIRERIPKEARISSITEEPYEGRVPLIDRTMAAFQMEHWGRAIPILLDMKNSIEQVGMAVREEGEKTRQELKQVIQKESEETRRVMREEGEKTRQELKQVIQKESEETRRVMRGLRGDIRDFIVKEIEEIKKRLDRLETALSSS